jgi:AcrR family transcriptional regulator
MTGLSDQEGKNPLGVADGDFAQDLHLWKLPRGRHGLPRELVEQSQRERLLAAVIRVTATKGYQASSVADILNKAGVGRETFYQHFKNKENCFMAANDALIADLDARVTEVYAQPGDWPERVRRGLAETLQWFADNAQVARVMMIETGTVGAAAGPRFRQTFRRFTALLDEGREFVDDAPDLPNLASIAGGAVFARVYEEVTLGNGANLPQMLPQLTFELLLPYLGEENAAAERAAAAEEVAEAEADEAAAASASS